MKKRIITPGDIAMKRRARARTRITETIQVRSNLIITARERGKIVARRVGHNIWLNLGREYLAQLICYQAYLPAPPQPVRNDRIMYMAVGIGGNRQLALSVANSDPLLTAYPGTNAQTDTDPTITTLERPVRLTGGFAPYPGSGGDVWLGKVVAPPTWVPATSATFDYTVTQTQVSYDPFLTVPLSEVMLFTSNADPSQPPLASLSNQNTGVAYDTFDTISKTDAFDLEISWTVRF